MSRSSLWDNLRCYTRKYYLFHGFFVRVEHQSKVSGPLLERIDIHYKVPPLATNWIDAKAAESSETVRQRVTQCRELQLKRQGALNARLKGSDIKLFCNLSDELQAILETHVQQKAWSTRVVHAILKMARTAADMRLSESIETEDLMTAINCRQPFSKKEEGRLYWQEIKKTTSQ